MATASSNHKYGSGSGSCKARNQTPQVNIPTSSIIIIIIMSSTTAQQVTIRIPDTLRNWPWPRTINPHYEECKTESEAWIESFKVFGPKAQQAFTKCNFSRFPEVTSQMAFWKDD